jgi:hypothetical protein
MLVLAKNGLKILLLIIMSFLIVAVICNYKGDSWEELVRNTLYKISNDSIPNYSKEIVDKKGIPYVYYREQNGITAGNQYNATIVCNYAIDYYKDIQQTNNSATRTKFLNCVNWLENNITYKDNYGLYQFNWQQPWYLSVGSPFTSGMTSGRAIEAFTDAYKLFHSAKYLAYAKALVRGFYQPIQSGGFTYKEPYGWWYEEIADTGLRTPRILDGHIYSITGVHELWLITKDDSAAYVVQKGIEALKHELPFYDVGNGWSYYDMYHKASDKKYHRLLTSQMKQLWTITNDPFFLQYYNKWNAPLQEPYVFRVIKEGNRSGLILYSLMVSIIFVLAFATTVITKSFFVFYHKYGRSVSKRPLY